MVRHVMLAQIRPDLDSWVGKRGRDNLRRFQGTDQRAAHDVRYTMSFQDSRRLLCLLSTIIGEWAIRIPIVNYLSPAFAMPDQEEMHRFAFRCRTRKCSTSMSWNVLECPGMSWRSLLTGPLRRTRRARDRDDHVRQDRDEEAEERQRGHGIADIEEDQCRDRHPDRAED